MFTRSEMAGLFFCLASAEGAGLLFLPYCNTALYKRLQRLLSRPCNYTANTTKQRTELYSGVSGYLPYFASVVWSVCKAILHRLSYAGLYHSAAAPPACTRYKQIAGRCHQYRPGAPAEGLARRRSRCFPRPAACSLAPGQRSERAFWHPPPGGQSSGGRRGTTGGSRRNSFRAFAR